MKQNVMYTYNTETYTAQTIEICDSVWSRESQFHGYDIFERGILIN